MKYYFDNAATTFPKPLCLSEAIAKCVAEGAINAGRGSYDIAFHADQVMSHTRDAVRALLGQLSGQIVFAPSVTIALNQILLGLSWMPGDYVYSTPFEHNAVARVLQHLQQERKLQWEMLSFDGKSLSFDLDKIKQQFFLHPPKALVLSHASNVFGVITPVEEIAKLARDHGATVVIDGAQAGPLLPNWSPRSVDFYAFSGHKTFYGPFGIAGFWTNGRVRLSPILFGGTGSHSENLDMPRGYPVSMEVGSPNIIAIAGLKAACEWLNVTGPERILQHERRLLAQLLAGIGRMRGVRCWPAQPDNAVGIVSFVIDGYTPQEVGMIFDQQFGMAVRTGLHCAPLAHRLLGTLPTGTVRVGLGWFNSTNEVDELLCVMERLGE